MTTDDSERARQIAGAAREQNPEVREAFIRNAAGGHSDIGERALAFLRQADDSDTVVESRTGAPGALPPGTILKDRYLIVRELNRGGFGVVYIANDQQLHGKPVVIKLQLETLGDDPWFERKFAEEIRALAAIDHPGVVGALDSGKTPEGRPFLVMQYVQGHSLRTVMSTEGMPFDRVANIVRQTGQALNAAHEKRIWHRDLKPENIMLQPMHGGDEHVRLIDFGIATIEDLQASQRRTATRVAGSMSYMAPEQVLGQPSEATDIYGFGVIVYEMITGRKPFVPDGMGQLAGMQRAGVRIKPADLRPGLPLAAQKLILQALSYNPKDRPVSAAEFGDRLAEALLAGPARSSVGVHAGTLIKRRAVTSVAAIIVFAAVVAGGWWLTHSSPHGQISKPPTASDGGVHREQANSGERDNLAVELEFWNSIKGENHPDLYRQYLTKYPHGQFAGIAKVKLDALARPVVAAVVNSKSNNAGSSPTGPSPIGPSPIGRKLPALRASLNPDDYYGPLKGQLQWTGRLPNQTSLAIQGGLSDRGAVLGDLPRLPVMIEIPTGLSAIEAPSEQNKWDRLVLRNNTGKEMDAIAISWKIVK